MTTPTPRPAARNRRRRTRRAAIAGLAAGLVAGTALAGSPASAATSTSLYAYDFANAGSSVTNRAAANSSVPLRLQGAWSSSGAGVSFRGNTSGVQSVGVADPPAKAIDVGGGTAVGAAAVFTWNPGSSSCPSDSKNVVQIGRFAKGESQLKIQLSPCSGGTVKPQCRVAGANTPKSSGPVTGSGVITPGHRYRVECIKSPDASGSATVTIRLQDLTSGTTKTASASIPDTGRVSTSRVLSVANKYPLPSMSANTDQFVGVVRRVAVCSGTTVAAAQSCLGVAAPA